MKKTAVVFVTVLILLVGMLLPPVPSAGLFADASQPYAGNTTITILYTSDIHGNFYRNQDTGTLGYSGIAAIHQSIPDSILVDSGDYLTQSTFLAQNTIEYIPALMNAAGYLVTGIGEADLANGTAVLKNVQEHASFHMLSSNITTRTDRQPILGNTKIVDVKGVKLGFFSILNPEVRLSADLQDMSNIYLEDASKTAQNCVNLLQEEGADIIIALSHMGNEGNVTVDQIAAFVSGIDFILDGHDHVEENGRYVGETMIFNPGANGKKLLQLDLVLSASKSLTKLDVTQWFYESTKDLPIDESILQMENQIMEEQYALLETDVATSRVELPYQDSIRYQSEPLGNFIADAYRFQTGATVAIVDAGSIGAGIKAGAVTKADLLAVLPENRTIQTKRITPKVLKIALESSVSELGLLDDYSVDPATATVRFPQLSGCTVDVNLKNEPGKRIIKIVLDNGVSLNLTDDRSTLIIAGSHTILSGSNDYDIFALQPVVEEYGPEGQALLDYLRSSGEYQDYSQARIQTTDKQESYAGIIITVLLSLVLVVAILAFVIKLLTRVS